MMEKARGKAARSPSPRLSGEREGPAQREAEGQLASILDRAAAGGLLGEADIVQLLRDGTSFVIAEAGEPLRWISEGDRFDFWKTEVKRRLVAPDAGGFYLDDYPGQYCYVAALWHGVPSGSVIVLEKHH